MVAMGAEARNTIKGHGIVVGDVFDFYGYDETPTAQADRVVITKEGNLYVLTVTDGKFAGERVAKLGAAKKIWAAKVETSSAEDRAAAYAQRHHLTREDAAFIASEVEAITNVSEHGFSGHSRRPMECRLCGEPAEAHSTTTDEGSSRHMWIKARTPLVTDHVKAWSGRTARVLEAIAELGGTVDAWDLGSGRGWHKTAVRIVKDSGALIQTNPGESPATYTLTDMGRQACEWYGFTIAEPVKPVTVEIHTGDGTVITTDDVKARFAVAFGDAKKLGKVWSSSGRLIDPVDPIPANPQPFSDRDMRDQIVAYLGTDVDDFYVDGIVDHLIKVCNGAINIDDVAEPLFGKVIQRFHKPTEAEVWSGTDTLIKPSIRTALGRRKRKATKKARRAVKGGF